MWSVAHFWHLGEMVALPLFTPPLSPSTPPSFFHFRLKKLLFTNLSTINLLLFSGLSPPTVDPSAHRTYSVFCFDFFSLRFSVHLTAADHLQTVSVKPQVSPWLGTDIPLSVVSTTVLCLPSVSHAPAARSSQDSVVFTALRLHRGTQYFTIRSGSVCL